MSDAAKEGLKVEFERLKREGGLEGLSEKLKLHSLEDLTVEQKKSFSAFLNQDLNKKTASSTYADLEKEMTHTSKRLLQANHGPLPETIKNIEDLPKIL